MPLSRSMAEAPARSRSKARRAENAVITCCSLVGFSSPTAPVRQFWIVSGLTPTSCARSRSWSSPSESATANRSWKTCASFLLMAGRLAQSLSS